MCMKVEGWKMLVDDRFPYDDWDCVMGFIVIGEGNFNIVMVCSVIEEILGERVD